MVALGLADKFSLGDSLLLFGRSRIIVGHHRLTDGLFPAAAILLTPMVMSSGTSPMVMSFVFLTFSLRSLCAPAALTLSSSC